MVSLVLHPHPRTAVVPGLGKGVRLSMEYLAELADWSELVFAGVLLAGQCLAHEAGVWLGRRNADREGIPPEGVGVIVGGMLGLLAFVLALTLSFASNRFIERRAGALAEANAIGTAWIRAEAIGHPRGEAIARLLEEYAKVRMAFVEAGRDPARLEDLGRSTNALQSQMTGHLAVIVREQPTTVSTSLMTALNETFDAATTERFAYARGLPQRIFWLLIGLSLLSAGALGYQVGLRKRPLRALAGMLLVTWTIVTVDILDLASPRIGAFRMDADVYRWTLNSFKGGLQIPPAPLAR